MQNGKGDAPRNCFSSLFQKHFDEIEWREKGSYCEECGATFTVIRDEQQVVDISTGKVVGYKCYKNCNFN